MTPSAHPDLARLARAFADANGHAFRGIEKRAGLFGPEWVAVFRAGTGRKAATTYRSLDDLRAWNSSKS